MGHFVPQLEQQGWQQEAQASAARSAYGSWTKTVDGNEFLGTLTLVETAANNWDLRFRIVRAGAAPAANVQGGPPP